MDDLEVKPPLPAGFEFAPPPEPLPTCSSNTCIGGHQWIPTVAIAPCPGCGAPIVVVRLENCPRCNEPTKATSLRTDHLGYKQPIAPLCQGVGGPSESGHIDMERRYWKEAERGETPEGVQIVH